MRKTIKKLAALLLAGALAATAALPAFAATVEVKSAEGIYNADEKTFIAYEVFDGDWEGGKLTNLKAGDGIDWDSVDWATVNRAGFDNVNNADDLIAALNGADERAGQKVAKILKDYVKGGGTTVANGGSLPDGYYIVIDESELGDNEVANAALLQVAGDKVTINVKTDKPSVEKKIDGSKDADTGTTGLVDANNGQVNDLVPYVITTKVPNTSHYDHYFMEFNDKVSAGLDISAVNAEDKFSDYKVFIDDVEMNAGQYTLIVDATARTIKVSFKDVKGQDGKILKLTYNAKINKNAVVGVTGNPNEVTLKYTNSPDHSGDGEFDNDNYVSETPKDIVITYLTGIQILKVDADSDSPLEGAEFSIAGTRTVSTVVSGVEFVEDASGEYYKLATGAYTKTAPTDATAARYDSDASGKKFKKQSVDKEIKTETEVKVSAISGENGIITFNDLGAGTYTITELLAPDGYNKLENPIKVTIGFTAPGSVSTGEEECIWNKSAEENGSFSFDEASGLFKVTIENNGGSTLPSTGGMGTTIFYVIGGILVLAAVIVLISKRRVQQ